VLPKLRFPLYQHLTDISFPNGNKITIETKENKTKKYGLKWQSCGAKISYWEVQGSACYFVDIRGADCFHYPAQQYLHRRICQVQNLFCLEPVFLKPLGARLDRQPARKQ
jgi:hypothetical protein